MKNKIFFPFSLILVLFTLNLSAQVKAKFGKIDKADLEMTTYELDTGAHAVVLFDIGKVEFVYDQVDNSGFKVQVTRHKRIKILDNSAFDLANIEIRLFKRGASEERLNSFRAFTYNLEGGAIEKTKTSSGDLFREKVDKNWIVRKTALPGVKEGSVIEYQYTIVSDFLFNIDPWVFQSMVPVKWSEFSISVPEYFYYNKTFRGYEFGELIINDERRESDGFTVRGSSRQVDYSSTAYHWGAKNIPAFKLEPYSTTPKNYLGRVEFELSRIEIPGVTSQNYNTTWEDINTKLLSNEDFGGQINKTAFLKGMAQEVTKDATENAVKVGKIFEYVKQKMHWNGKYQKFASHGIKKSFEEEKGSSADINMILIAMLRAAGFEAHPVLVSTRSNGFINPSHPSQSQFNHVIAAVIDGDNYTLLDAIQNLLPGSLLPANTLNDKGRLISKEGSAWLSLKTKASYKIVTQAKLSIAEEGILEGRVKSLHSDYAGYSFRREYQGAESEEEFIKEIESEEEGVEIISHEFTDMENVYKRVTCDYEVKISDRVVDAGDLIYIDPMLHFGVDENPFKLEKREYPVDYAYPMNFTFVLELKKPEGYLIEELPESSRIALPEKSGIFSYTVNDGEDHILIRSLLKINKSIFVATEYPALKEFYNLIVEKHGEQIVLKKS